VNSRCRHHKDESNKNKNKNKNKNNNNNNNMNVIMMPNVRVPSIPFSRRRYQPLEVTVPEPKQPIPIKYSSFPSEKSLKSCLRSITATTRTNATESTHPFKKSVSFHKLIIREYSQIPDINPSVSSGPPIGLGWDYEVKCFLDITDYEEHRPPRRSRSQLNIPATVRHKMLRETFSIQDVNRATKLSNIGRHQRKTSFAMQDMEETLIMVESAKRRVKRLFSNRTTREQELESLWIMARTRQKREEKFGLVSLGCSISTQSTDDGMTEESTSYDPADIRKAE
jgi:hypothetical protein